MPPLFGNRSSAGWSCHALPPLARGRNIPRSAIRRTDQDTIWDNCRLLVGHKAISALVEYKARAFARRAFVVSASLIARRPPSKNRAQKRSVCLHASIGRGLLSSREARSALGARRVSTRRECTRGSPHRGWLADFIGIARLVPDSVLGGSPRA